MSKNYIGLSCLNTSLKLYDKEKLEAAKENFQQIIELNCYNLGDNMDVFQAFAKYNLARVKKNLSENAEAEYSIAIRKRDKLSKTSKFPQMFRLNFALERIYAEIDFYDYMLNNHKIDISNYIFKIEALQKEVINIRQTPVSDVSLFITLENRLERCLKKV